MELQHFSHDHRLIFNVHAKDGHSGINCNGCLLPVSGVTYECRQCEYVLHKSCVELPKKIIHYVHPEHPLTLLSKSRYEWRPSCSKCKEIIWGLIYNCFICNYNLHMKCVQMGSFVNHEGHVHSFMVHRPSPFACDICEESSNNVYSYMCSTCQLWVHKHCVSLPISDSIHTLNLPSTFPTVVEDLQESRDAASGEEQAVSLITSDVSKISLDENDMLSTIQHFSHECQLILTNDEPQNEETCDELENEEICEEPQKAKICNGCVRPISAPFYKGAGSCKFFLHPRCAQLPTTIRSILHPHPLTLLSGPRSTTDLFICRICLKICTGFAYKCNLCNFRIDARCASISKNTLKHDGHEHILSLVQKMSKSNCSSCGSICRTRFSCEDCDFNLDLRCALLPLTARHRWDEKHPLKLTFVNVEHISKFYFCDLCEEVRNPDHWYYCCKECDLSAHTTCLLGKHDVKFGCGTYPLKSLHDHSLKILAEKSKNKYGCKSECDTDNTDVVLECPTCDYHTHKNFFDYFFN